VKAHLHVAAIFIEAGAPFDFVSCEQLCKFAGSSTYAIQALMKRGVVVRDLRDDEDNTPLQDAAVSEDVLRHWGLECDLVAVRMLVNVCGVDLDACNSSRNTCIAVFARHRRDGNAMFRCLIECGADVNFTGFDGASLLHNEINCERLVLLLAAGADVRAVDNSQRTALDYCTAWWRGTDDITAKSNMHTLLAAGVDYSALEAPRKTNFAFAVDAKLVESKRCEIAKVRLDFVRYRALQVCIGLQSLRLDALQMCEILQHAVARWRD
jgi:hypothetical protein